MNNFIKHFVMLVAMMLANISVAVAADFSEVVRGDTLYFNFEADSTLSFVGTSNREIDSLFIPETVQGIEVTSIGDSAMDSCVTLVYVKIPNSVKVIKSAAFYRCSSLESVILPENTNKLGIVAFAYCTNLQYVEIRSKDPNIDLGSLGFDGCLNIRTVKFYGLDYTYTPQCTFLMISDEVFDNITFYIPKGGYFERYNYHCGYSKELKKVIEFDPEEEDNPDNSIQTILSNPDNGEIDVYNMQGVKVLSTTSKSDIDALPKGLYILKTEETTEKYLVK